MFRFTVAFSLVVLACVKSPEAFCADEMVRPHRMALLVGCTTYPLCDTIRPLRGPANDLPLFHSVLTEQFGFENDEITTLLGWPDEIGLRPTCANITAEFERLIEHAKPGSQVVVLMSGHGTQVPAKERSLDSEVDSLDEAFLPADVRSWGGDEIPGAIIDDQFSTWLNALSQKGANVWIIFDACHSGTMTRSVSDAIPSEVARGINPEDLGVPPVRRSSLPNHEIERQISNRSESQRDGAGRGTITAFFAAQAFEEAPELPRPSSAPRVAANYYGLFTYSLVQALKKQPRAISYRDLSQAVLNAYRAERGSREPTPGFEGEMHREVLGNTVFNNRLSYPAYEVDGHYEIGAGTLHGFTAGSIVSLSSGQSDTTSVAIGHLKVSDAAATTSRGTPCSEDGTAAAKEKEFPRQVQCRLVYQELGDTRIRVAITSEAVSASNAGIEDKIRGLLDPEKKFVELVDASAAPDWSIGFVTADSVQTRFGYKTNRPSLVWTPGAPNAEKAGRKQDAGVRSIAFVRDWPGEANADELDQIKHHLASDVREIFTWQNLWKIADSPAVQPEEDADLHLSVTVERNGSTVENPAKLFAREKVTVSFVNDGSTDYWFTILFLGSDLSITSAASGSLKRHSQMRPMHPTVNENSLGAEGLIVLATSLSIQHDQPDYNFLEQSGLANLTTTRSVRPRSGTVLGRLMEGVAGESQSRGLSFRDSSQPTVLSRTWVTAKKDEKTTDSQLPPK